MQITDIKNKTSFIQYLNENQVTPSDIGIFCKMDLVMLIEKNKKETI